MQVPLLGGVMGGFNLCDKIRFCLPLLRLLTNNLASMPLHTTSLAIAHLVVNFISKFATCASCKLAKTHSHKLPLRSNLRHVGVLYISGI